MHNNQQNPIQPICNTGNPQQFHNPQINFVNNNQLPTFIQQPQNPHFNQLVFQQGLHHIGQNINQQQLIHQKIHFPLFLKDIEKQDLLTISGIEYKKLKLLGKGSYGSVYMIQNKQTLEFYALKIQTSIQKEEVEILSRLKQKTFKNLVNTIEFQKHPETNEYFLLMEYCENSLQNIIDQKPIDHKEARYIIKQIANGIKELHEEKIIHRDLKPENILVFVKKDQNSNMTQNIYKICDFGLSSTKDLAKTLQCGTAHYMPPEQIKHQNNLLGYDQSVDIWAFGTVIYELFTQKVMFMKSNRQEVYEEILKITQKQIDEKIQTDLKMLDQQYVKLVQKMILIEPSQRITIDQVLIELKQQSTNIATYNVNKENIIKAKKTMQKTEKHFRRKQGEKLELTASTEQFSY
ncbi:unnamed protein product (macronuclear) [Paramecium tetraurelia]|uniref:Protein kinase domain-containing protein n=1 Tax=Paramecium tetraurelia TaxID=5888 RepID=A0DQG3_PARTE|nr:uncharacterized protein GSPATT00002680001 [Paramecium tetraurelia]CAK85280.1 unnamed protein product [Paramecium tetraurelia]|eukprot:XP_001452677.1 hypothetical protein (macronuclear) [Paramecium tetraurelia strain d4-2]